MSHGGMTNEQFNAHLELLARLIEASAKTPEDAARIVRESKVEAGVPEKHHEIPLSFESESLAVPEVHVGRRE